ncbi:C-C motif chemokine 4-like [Toxotes jaculatrix]|uniref:C-C motif chemokine 4-like n=1 Tax=Toxotes jaculatrix TaxID=941984 RepID=UPI001B3AB7B0|nr:C-C motif chemokine 4-like [Toxotes jaculatrix]
MKTLCFTLGLVLLTVCCCNAIPVAVNDIKPIRCCYRFSERDLPLKLVSDITKTRRSCARPAFIVHTVRGKQICYSETFPWAVNVYKQLHEAQGSGQQH